jgi:tetratricopeptide (TPR) repeat protein
MPRTCARVALLVITASAGLLSQTRQSAIEEARVLYYAAAYEQALAALDRVEPASTNEATTAELFRGASLLALGRSEDAEHAFERLVTLRPDLLPEQLDMTPWIASRFAAVRARVLTDRERRERAAGRRRSEAVEPGQPDFYTLADALVSRPVPIREHIPEPPAIDGVDLSGTATLLVDIAVDGSVDRVSLEGSIHPRIDDLIRQSARTWLYRPATLDGRPVKFRKALKIEIRLR